MINISKKDLSKNPFWYIKKSKIIDLELFENLKKDYPDDELYESNLDKFGARAGDDLFPCDYNFKKLIDSSYSWRIFCEYLNSKSFLDKVFNIFYENLLSEGLKVDLKKYNLKRAYTPSRIQRAESQKNLFIKKIFYKFANNINDLYVTCDISRAKEGYGLKPHCDHRYRLFSLIIYFTNPSDIEMNGGNLEIYKRNNLNIKSRNLDETELSKVISIKPEENLGIIFPSHNYSYHGVSPISEIKGYRKFIYIGISSKNNFIWD